MTTDLSSLTTGELIDELVSRALIQGEPYLRLYSDDLTRQLDQIASVQKREKDQVEDVSWSSSNPTGEIGGIYE